MARRTALAGALAVWILAMPQASSQVSVKLTLFASGLSSPVDIASAGDNRLFVVEQGGRIKIVESNGVVSATFLDISGRVLAGGEQGLLGLAFPADYASSGRFFVYYTRRDGNNQLSSFARISATQANPASEVPILTLAHPTFSNHNGGDLNFRDGLLYISTGDGGGGNDPANNAQNRESLLGKILRLDVSRDQFPTDPSRNYGIPPSNPFAATTGADEIWTLGLRNPWRFSFDSANGNMYIGDVGQSAREEIDFQAASSAGGENYGWRCYEGTRATNVSKCAKAPAYTAPVSEYERIGARCAVTGGYVYRGAANPFLQGQYLFMDFCSGELWGFQTPAAGAVLGPARLLGTFGINASSFGRGHNGELYVADISGGAVYRVEGS